MRLASLARLSLALALPGAFVRAVELSPRTWTVDGLQRTALVHFPDVGTDPAPLVFVFHGHGGSSRQVSETLSVHRLWPEAIVVYPQGLPTPGSLTDPEGRQNGWQSAPSEQGDRDLRFFDLMLADLLAGHAVNRHRIYATGHSNGGSFTYLLWSRRREVFAAFGPSGAVANRACLPLQPAPVIQASGTNDTLVRFAWQKAMLFALLRLNQCAPGREAGPLLVRYASPINCPVQTYFYPGGHQFPPGAASAIVAFFKAQPSAKSGGT